MAKGATLTYADLASFPDDHLRREIIDGELIVSPSPRTRHQRISARLHLALGGHVAAHGGGEVFYEHDVILSKHNVVEPDLIFVAKEQREIVTELNIQGTPALLIEVLSDARRDRIIKRDLYARHGVPEYWVIDPDADRVEVYRRSGETGETYAKPLILEPGEPLTYERLPGLSIDLAALFAR